MEQRTAIILGATGLVGECLTRELADSNAYHTIHLLVRRPSGITHPRIKEHIVDFEKLDEYRPLFSGADVYCCIGTTMKQAGSKEAFRKVDYDIPVNAAKAANHEAGNFLLISSIGARTRTSNFYLRTKGETEQAILKMNIPGIHILRPSMLLGNRREKRTGEKIGMALLAVFQPLLIGGWRKYRGIEATAVARAMINLALENKPGKFIHESDELQYLSTRKSPTALPSPDA